MVVRSEDVARRAGVSRATVSQILNGHGARFTSDTRARVEQAAAELNYQPSAAARTLRSGSSDFVVALIPDTTFGANLQDLFEDATEEFGAHGLTLVLRLPTRDPASLARTVAALKPRAVMSLAPFSEAERTILDTSAVLWFEASADDLAAFDNLVGQAQARHLLERGHRRLAFAHLRDARQDPFGSGREEGVRSWCRDAGLTEPEVIHLGVDLGDATAALGALGPGAVGVACYNDDVAMALLGAARTLSLRVPDDVALIGMDHTRLGQVAVPRLSTVSYDVTAAGRAAMSLVLNGITGGTAENAGPSPDLDLRVVQGGTT